MAEIWQWHEIFGVAWVDFFRGTTVDVKQEFDTSVQQQKIDIIIVRPSGEAMPRELPDGFEPLAAHNLISFKSHHEALTPWTLEELVGHFVSYCKHVSPGTTERDLLPRENFKLFAVTARFPRGMASGVELVPVSAGCYDVKYFAGSVRVLVINELPCEQQNAVMHLFSADDERVRYASKTFKRYSERTGGMLAELLKHYGSEDVLMPATLEEIDKRFRESLLNDPDYVREVLEKASPDDRVAGLAPAERIRGLTPEQLAELIRSAQQQIDESQKPSQSGE